MKIVSFVLLVISVRGQFRTLLCFERANKRTSRKEESWNLFATILQNAK